MPVIRNSRTNETRVAYEGEYVGSDIWMTDSGESFAGLVPLSGQPRRPPTAEESRAGKLLLIIALLIVLVPVGAICLGIAVSVIAGGPPQHLYPNNISDQRSSRHPNRIR